MKKYIILLIFSLFPITSFADDPHHPGSTTINNYYSDNSVTKIDKSYMPGAAAILSSAGLKYGWKKQMQFGGSISDVQGHFGGTVGFAGSKGNSIYSGGISFESGFTGAYIGITR